MVTYWSNYRFSFSRISENFENANLIDVINGLDVQDQKLNDIITKSSTTEVTFNKNIVTNKNIKASGHISSGKDIVLNSNGTIKAKNFLITDKIASVGGDTKAELTKTDIKKMKSLKMIAGYAINGDGTTHLLFEGYHKLHENKFQWAHDRWDTIYIFKGWKVQTWDDAKKGKQISNTENKNEDVKMVDVQNDKISEYEVTWVDY